MHLYPPVSQTLKATSSLLDGRKRGANKKQVLIQAPALRCKQDASHGYWELAFLMHSGIFVF